MNARRLACCEAVAQSIRVVGPQARLLCVLCIDIDRLTALYATFGAAAGDQIFGALEQRIRHCLQPADLIFRLPGDECVIVALSIAAEGDAERLAARVVSTISEPLYVDGLPQLQCTSSIGIAVFPNDGHSAADLLDRAELVMTGLKARGHNAYARFAPGALQPSYAFVSFEHRLFHGLEHGEFQLYFAPVIDIGNTRLVAIEALPRWMHPELGILSSASYATEPISSVVLRVERTMLCAACEQATHWRDELGDRVPPLTMNISLRCICDAGFIDTLRDALARNRLAAENLQLEVDESDLVAVDGGGSCELESIAGLGVRIVVGRFGAGSSSLRFLRQFPITMLKLDTSCTCDSASPKDRTVLTRAIVAGAHNAGLSVAATGVETQDQWDFLRLAGCDAVAGPLAGRPLPVREASARLSRRGADRRSDHADWQLP